MERKQFLKTTRKQMNCVGATVLIYYAMMSFFAIIGMLLDLAAYFVGLLIRSQSFDMDAMMDYLMASLTSNGWGYLLTIAVGTLIVLLWKGKDFWKTEMFAKNKPMTLGTFFQLLAVFLSAQFAAQIFAVCLEGVLNLFGLSATAALEAATITSTGFSMFLYVTLLGPISEELLFRGLLLRMLKPWGKQTAIIISALMFGLFHGNLIQIPFAFLVGVVLGYVTVEYSIVWAILLHIFNNLVMSDLLGRLIGLLPEMAGIWVMYGILAAFAIVALVLLIVKHRQVSEFFAQNRCHGLTMRAMITSPVIILFILLMLGMSVLTITPI